MLADHGIDAIVDAPGVGRNLQEHVSFPLSYFIGVPTLNTMMGPLAIPRALLRYFASGTGLMRAGPVLATAMMRSHGDLAHPDIKLSFGPVCFDVAKRKPHHRAGIRIFVNVASPGSRGEIRRRAWIPLIRR